MKLRCDEPPYNFAINFNLRPWAKDMSRELKIQSEEGLDAKLQDLEYQAGATHSSTSHLNVNTFCGVHLVVSVTQTAQVEPRSGRV